MYLLLFVKLRCNKIRHFIAFVIAEREAEEKRGFRGFNVADKIIILNSNFLFETLFHRNSSLARLRNERERERKIFPI